VKPGQQEGQQRQDVLSLKPIVEAKGEDAQNKF